MAEELPALIRDGYSSLKLFMTYPLLRLDDAQMLDLLALARRERAMVSVHAENDAMIAWTARRLLERGHTRAQIPRDQPSARRRGRGGRAA